MDRLRETSNEIRECSLAGAVSDEEQSSYTEALFESIKHINEYGQEFWYARELQRVLEYAQWRRFNDVIERAMKACKNSGNSISEHFARVGKTILMPKSAIKEILEYQLSRYACYLIVQNGDPHKKVIALGQTHFAVKTRQQELIDNFDEMSEDQKRLAIRQEMKEPNKKLVAAVRGAGVESSLDYAIFQNYGYMGLYGGLKAQDIRGRKKLKKSQNILDHMGYEELAANLFRATQTEAKLKREQVQGKENANDAHYTVGKEVRETIKRLGGTMPENLPTPEKSIKEIEREEQKKLK